MNLDHKLPRLVPPAALVLAVTVVLGGVALAAGTSVTLKLKGNYAKRTRVACHENRPFRLYHRRSRVEYKGVVTPHPAHHFAVRLEIKHCVRGTWRRMHSHYTLGKKLTGKYKGFLSARPLAPSSHKRGAVNYYFARAVVNGRLSRKEFFAVTN